MSLQLHGLQKSRGSAPENLTTMPQEAQKASPAIKADPGQVGEFEQFMEAHPEHLMLSKNEQFAAFREWRRQQGKTWAAKPEDPAG